MGQDYSLITLSAASANINVPQLADISYDKTLGNARFMKCARARHQDGFVVAKMVVKPYARQANNQRSVQNVQPYVDKITKQERILSSIPNALSYHRIVETEFNGYFIRQYIHSSLYDRISTRPFLEDAEKKWLAFQLLCALRDCHAKNIYHGDIKAENVLVTSFHWLYLADFSSPCKPTYLPEDDPATFSFYFDTSGRRVCYIAPERFRAKGDRPTEKLNGAMDIFSAGCVIAELFLETPIFDLHSMLQYRMNNYDPSAQLKDIADPSIRAMVTQMTSLDPKARLSAGEYIKEWTGSVFPVYFAPFLHSYMYRMTDPSEGLATITTGAENLGESDYRIECVYVDFERILKFLGYGEPSETRSSSLPLEPPLLSELSTPLYIDVPNPRHAVKRMVDPSDGAGEDQGILIFLTLVVSSLRSTARATTRVKACDLLLAFAERLKDETTLERILPYIVTMFNDPSDLVRVAALRAVTQLTEMVETVSPVDSYLFPDYLLPRLQAFLLGHPSKPNAFVRAAYAGCIAKLANNASRFLELAHGLHAGKPTPFLDADLSDPTNPIGHQSVYDITRMELVREFEDQVKDILSDEDSTVRRAFLGSVSSLCTFFGTTQVIDVILRHINTYLNDRDWRLKSAFFETIVALGTFVGAASLKEYILPLMIQALSDPEEFVIEQVIRSLNSMAELGLFRETTALVLLEAVCRFTIHPNIWIRDASCQFITSMSTFMSVAEYYALVIPLIVPYISFFPTTKSNLLLLEALKPPLARRKFMIAKEWATAFPDSVFWAGGTQPKKGNVSLINNLLRQYNSGLLDRKLEEVNEKEKPLLLMIPSDEQEKKWVERLNEPDRLSREDEMKLLTLHQFIWVTVQRTPKPDQSTSLQQSLALLPPKGFFPIWKVNFMPVVKLVTGDSIEEGSEIGAAAESPRSTAPSNFSTREMLSSSKRGGSPVKEDDSHTSAKTEEGLQESGNDIQTSNFARLTISIDMRGRTRRDSYESNSESYVGDCRLGERPVWKGGTKSQLAAAKLLHKSSAIIRYVNAHDYNGRDPILLRLLDRFYLEYYPLDDDEFGLSLPPVNKSNFTRANETQLTAPWKPQGILVGLLSEHTAAVNRIAVSTDHTFFVTASDDGSIKVWDTARLERHISNRSRATFNLGSGVRVLNVTFIEQTCTFACSGSDGRVVVLRPEQAKTKGWRLHALQVVRQHRLGPDEMAIWMEHFRTERHSLLLMLTNKGSLIGFDLKEMRELYRLENPVKHGRATTFCISHDHEKAIVGTDLGILDIWDLSKQELVRSVMFKDNAPVSRLAFAPAVGLRNNRLYVAGGFADGSVTVWDIDKTICLEAYIPSTSTSGPGSVPSREDLPGLFTLVDVTAERMAPYARPELPPHPSDLGVPASGWKDQQTARALAVGCHVPISANSGASRSRCFAVTAGADWRVRFWDASQRGSSCLVTGLRPDEDEARYGIEVVEVGGGVGASKLTVVTEDIRPAVDGGTAAASAGVSPSGGRTSFARSTFQRLKRGVPGLAKQTHLLREHLDEVTDVALVESPYGMVVSADRSGVVYVIA